MLPPRRLQQSLCLRLAACAPHCAPVLWARTGGDGRLRRLAELGGRLRERSRGGSGGGAAERLGAEAEPPTI